VLCKHEEPHEIESQGLQIAAPPNAARPRSEDAALALNAGRSPMLGVHSRTLAQPIVT